MTPFTENQFLELGFEALRDKTWLNSSRAMQEQNFRSLYGMSARVLSKIWSDLQAKLEEPLPSSTNPVYLLVTYRWLKSYLSEPELKSEFSIGVKSVREWSRYFVVKIASLRAIKIDKFWLDDGGFQLGRTTDCIHYPITEPRPFDTIYSSHKIGGKAALVYEYCLDTWRDQIVWLNGPFPAGTQDRTVFSTKGLKKAVEDLQAARGNTEIRIIADDGYFKEELVDTLSFRNEFDPLEIEWYKDRSLSRHETFNGRTTNFRCLVKKFHHDRSSDNTAQEFPKHQACVEAICVTIQYEFDLGETKLLDPYPS